MDQQNFQTTMALCLLEKNQCNAFFKKMGKKEENSQLAMAFSFCMARLIHNEALIPAPSWSSLACYCIIKLF